MADHTPLSIRDLAERRYQGGIAVGKPTHPWQDETRDFAAEIKEECADAWNYFIFWKKRNLDPSHPNPRAVLDILQAQEYLRKAFELVEKIEAGLKGGGADAE